MNAQDRKDRAGYSESRFRFQADSCLDGRRTVMIVKKTCSYTDYSFDIAREDDEPLEFMDGKSAIGLLSLGVENETPLILRVYGDEGRKRVLFEVTRYIMEDVRNYSKGNYD